MTKFAGINRANGSPVIGIALTGENLLSLLEGRTIQFDTASMFDLPKIEVYILMGEDEATIKTLSETAGLPEDGITYTSTDRKETIN